MYPASFECNSVTWVFYRPELLYFLKYVFIGLKIIQKDILCSNSIVRVNNVLTDLIIGVICKILTTFFTFVYLQIACTNYLFLTLQTTGAPYVLRGIYLWNILGVIGRRRRTTFT